MLTPLHLRLAMAAFDLTRRSLAPQIGVFETTIGRFLQGDDINSGTVRSLTAFFEVRGVEFIYDAEAPGVRVRKAPAVMAGAAGPRKALPAAEAAE